MFPSGDSPQITRWIAFVFAIIALLFFGFSTVSLVSAHSTGTATYRYGPRGILREEVTKQNQPQKFREAVEGLYFSACVTGLLSYVSFLFFRKLGE